MKIPQYVHVAKTHPSIFPRNLPLLSLQYKKQSHPPPYPVPIPHFVPKSSTMEEVRLVGEPLASDEHLEHRVLLDVSNGLLVRHNRHVVAVHLKHHTPF